MLFLDLMLAKNLLWMEMKSIVVKVFLLSFDVFAGALLEDGLEHAWVVVIGERTCNLHAFIIL